VHAIAQRTTPGASGIAGDILVLSVGSSVAHRAAPSEGRVNSLILCRWASVPANVIITSHVITAKTFIGAIALFCADNVSTKIICRSDTILGVVRSVISVDEQLKLRSWLRVRLPVLPFTIASPQTTLSVTKPRWWMLLLKSIACVWPVQNAQSAAVR